MTEVWITLTHNIEVPSVHMIEQIFESIKHPNVVAHKMLKHKHHPGTVFPEHVLGERCTPEPTKIVTEYIPHLIAKLTAANQEEVHAATLYLEITGRVDVLPCSSPTLKQGHTSCCPPKDGSYDLAGVNHKYRGTFLPIYSACVFNQGENRKLKIAALAAMLPMGPHTAHLQKLAVSTWFQQDEAVAKCILTSPDTLTHIKRTDMPPATRMAREVEKAVTTLPLSKPFPGTSSTSNHFFAEMRNNLGVGYLSHTAVSHTDHTNV